MIDDEPSMPTKHFKDEKSYYEEDISDSEDESEKIILQPQLMKNKSSKKTENREIHMEGKNLVEYTNLQISGFHDIRFNEFEDVYEDKLLNQELIIKLLNQELIINLFEDGNSSNTESHLLMIILSLSDSLTLLLNEELIINLFEDDNSSNKIHIC